MDLKIYSKFPKWAMIIVVSLVIIVIVFVIRFAFVRGTAAPQEFLDAQNEVSSIAQSIVEASNESIKNINETSRLSNEGKDDEALNIVSREIINNRQTSGKGLELLSKLQAMTNSTAGITPESSQQIAFKAMIAETKLITNLNSYNGNLSQLLEVLKLKLLGQGNDLHQKIVDLVGELNAEAKGINASNQEFNDLMNQFDKGK